MSRKIEVLSSSFAVFAEAGSVRIGKIETRRRVPDQPSRGSRGYGRCPPEVIVSSPPGDRGGKSREQRRPCRSSRSSGGAGRNFLYTLLTPASLNNSWLRPCSQGGRRPASPAENRKTRPEKGGLRRLKAADSARPRRPEAGGTWCRPPGGDRRVHAAVVSKDIFLSDEAAGFSRR